MSDSLKAAKMPSLSDKLSKKEGAVDKIIKSVKKAVKK